MHEPTPPRWRRKRWLAAAALAVVLAYPVSFVPACWTLMRVDPLIHADEWHVVRVLYRPAATLLMACPEGVHSLIGGAVNLLRTERAAVSIQADGIGVVLREQENGQDYVVSYVVW